MFIHGYNRFFFLCRWFQTVCKPFLHCLNGWKLWSTHSRLRSKILAEFAARTVFEILRVSLNTILQVHGSGLYKKNTLTGYVIQIWQFLRWFLAWQIEQYLLTFSSRFDSNLTALVSEIIEPWCHFPISSWAVIFEFGSP
jgi:hypothetical protein